MKLRQTELFHTTNLAPGVQPPAPTYFFSVELLTEVLNFTTEKQLALAPFIEKALIDAMEAFNAPKEEPPAPRKRPKYLTDAERLLILSKYAGGMSQAEIAADMQVSKSNVSNIINRFLKGSK